MNDRMGAVLAGLSVISVGLVLLFAQWIGWDRIWPLFPILGGLVCFGGYAASGFKESGLIFLGTAATLLGVFLFGFSLGYWEWAQMRDLWPVFILIGGVACLALFLVDRGHDVGVLGVGCTALIAGGVGFAVTHGLVGEEIVKLWPLLLVLLGLFGLIGGLVRLVRRT